VSSEAIPSPARDAVRSESNSSPGAPGFERIALPLKMSSSGEIAHDDLRKLLSSQSNLIAYDRVLSPRELASRFQHQLEEIFPGVEATFHAVEMPARSAWPQIEWNKMPISREDVEACVARRDHVVRGTLPDGSSYAILPAGDAQIDWSGFLFLKRRGGAGFDPDSLALATLAIEHFSETLSTLMRLEGLIFYDFLTGIYNRSYYEEQIEKEVRLSQRRDQSMALLIVDIDDFKGFNTRYGYDGGDRVLATVACILKSALRGTDTLARYGGEEFAVILAPPVPREEAVAIAERLRAAVAEEPFEIQDLEGRLRREQLTVSIGGALLPEHGTTSRELWAVANRLILDAKQTGKNAVRFAPSKSEVR
jgi:diguanylate cyclase (GGDEF)-like protein